MKQHTQFFKAALFLLFSALSLPLHAQREYAVDACVHQLLNNVYKTRANNFNRYFKCSTVFHKWQCDTLSRTDFDTLKNLLYSNASLKPRSDSFFYAFHIFLGLEDTNIRLIYVPVFADYIQTNPVSGAWQFRIIPALAKVVSDDMLDNSQVAFVREGGKLVRKAATDVMSFISAYRESVKIDATGCGEWREFVDRSDELGDTKAVLFSFQAIDALFNLGLNEEDFEQMFVINIAERDAMGGLNTLKHSIAFSPVMPDDPNPSPVAENVGTLCPPGCISSEIQMIDHKPAPPYTYYGY